MLSTDDRDIAQGGSGGAASMVDSQLTLSVESRLDLRGKHVVLLLAKTAITGAADTEMSLLAEQLAVAGQSAAVRYAYSEQGSPSMREALMGFADEGVAEVLILPLLMPAEPAFRLWISRSVERWIKAASEKPWPRIRIAEPPARAVGTLAWLRGWLESSESSPLAQAPPRAPEGSIVPPQQRRVLVCQGGPCNEAGAAVVWAHLRNEQKRLNLRTTGVGVMTCKTTCLGPCNLAPVMQVFPEGTYYGGVDEQAIDTIVQRHLLDGSVATEYAYAATPERQRLRQNTFASARSTISEASP